MRYPLLILFWLISDYFIFVVAYTLAYFLRVGWIFSTDFPFGKYFFVVYLVAPFWLLVLITTRTFALGRRQNTGRNLAYITYASIVGVALFALTYYFSYGLFFSRKLLLFALILNIGMVWSWHMLFERLLRRVMRLEPSVFRALIIGITRESKKLIKELNRTSNPIKPVAVLDGRGSKEKEIDGVPVCGKLNNLEKVLKEDGITHIVQCADLEQTLNLLSACRQHNIVFMLLPSVLGIVERDERVESLEGHPVTMVNPKEKRWEWFFR